MPTYTYRRGRKTIERHFSMNAVPETVEYKGLVYKRSREDDWSHVGVPSLNSKCWPMECVASGVHPSQSNELREFFRRSGCPTEVSEDGNPIYRDMTHRRKALKLRGFKDRGGFF